MPNFTLYSLSLSLSLSLSVCVSVCVLSRYYIQIQLTHMNYTGWWLLTNVFAKVITTSIKIMNSSITLENALIPSHSHPSTQETTNRTLFNINFAYSEISYKWNHTLWTVLCVIFFVQHSICEINPMSSLFLIINICFHFSWVNTLERKC